MKPDVTSKAGVPERQCVGRVRQHGPLDRFHSLVIASPESIGQFNVNVPSAGPSPFSHHPVLLCAVQLPLTSDLCPLTPDPWLHSHATPFCGLLSIATRWSLPGGSPEIRTLFSSTGMGVMRPNLA